MDIVFPQPLRAGSKIGIVAPSSPVPAALAPRLELVKETLRAHGWTPLESHCLRGEQTASWQTRLDAWMEALLSDEIDAVMPPWGGDLAIELVGRMNFARLRDARPKWILGYSDISTLLVPMLLELGWASAHGPNLMDLVPRQRDPISLGCLPALSAEGPFTQHSSTHHQTAFVDWKRHPDAPFQLDQPSFVQTLDGRALRVEGRLIGGCLDTISSLAGSRFGDVPRFVREHAEEGVIVFLENCELSPGQATRALVQLRLAGWFDGVRAVVLGRSQAPGARGEDSVHAIRSIFEDLHVPVVLDADIGHVPPQWTMIEGALATLEVDEGRGVITQMRSDEDRGAGTPSTMPMPRGSAGGSRAP